MYKVLLVEEQTLIRSAVAGLIDQVADFQVVGQVGNAGEALERVRRGGIDLVVMEWRLSGMGGIELVQRIARLASRPKVMVCTSYFESPLPARLMHAGADVFVSRHVGSEEFERALRIAAQGGRYISQDVQSDYLSRTLRGVANSDPMDQLSEREFQVVMMYIEGQGVKDIAEKLCISPKTVCTYRARACEKLGVRGEAALARLALRYGAAMSEPIRQSLPGHIPPEYLS